MHVRQFLAIVSLVFFASCSACSPSEWAAEKLIEKATGISVDEKAGTVTFKSKEGEFTLSDKGEEAVIAIKGKDGEEVRIGSSEKKLPQGFPLRLIDGATIASSMSVGKGKNESFIVTLEAPANSHERIAEYYERELRSKGVEVERTRFEVEGNVSISLTGNGDDGVTSSVSVWSDSEASKTVATISWEKSVD